MKLTNYQVKRFVEIASKPTNTTMKGKQVFALAILKHKLIPAYRAIIETQQSIAKELPVQPGPDAKEEEINEYNAAIKKADAEFVEVLNTKIEVGNIGTLSIEALSAFDLTPEEAEFILHLPFIEENVLDEGNEA